MKTNEEVKVTPREGVEVVEASLPRSEENAKISGCEPTDKDNSKRLREWSMEAYGPKDALRSSLLASSYLKQVADAYEVDFCRNLCYKPHSIRAEVDKVLQHVKSWQEFFKETYTTEHAVYNLHFCYITDVAEESK